MSTEITVHSGQALFKASTDAASLCKAIVTATARKIQGRSYVQVEGWQAIATAHGCVASAGEVRRITDEGGAGYMAIGRVVRMDTGAEICSAEGFVGDDERMWAGRPVYARRAMAQTRAISRACRSAFAHVVVMMQAGLETTPAEEVPPEGFEVQGEVVREPARPVQQPKTDAHLGEDYVSHVAAAIREAQAVAELSTIHDDAMAACKAAGDRDAAKRIKALLTERKKQLEAQP
jgi:hypothetical protein